MPLSTTALSTAEKLTTPEVRSVVGMLEQQDADVLAAILMGEVPLLIDAAENQRRREKVQRSFELIDAAFEERAKKNAERNLTDQVTIPLGGAANEQYQNLPPDVFGHLVSFLAKDDVVHPDYSLSLVSHEWAKTRLSPRMPWWQSLRFRAYHGTRGSILTKIQRPQFEHATYINLPFWLGEEDQEFLEQVSGRLGDLEDLDTTCSCALIAQLPSFFKSLRKVWVLIDRYPNNIVQ